MKARSFLGSLLQVPLLASLGLALFAFPASGAELNFEQAVAQALKANPRLAESAAQTEAAAAGVEAARGLGLPKLRLEANVTRSDNALSVLGFRLAQRQATFHDFGLTEFSGPGSLNSAPAALNSPGYVTNYGTGMALTVPVYSGGADTARLQGASAELAAAREGKRQRQAELVFQVLSTYQGVHAARGMLDAARRAKEAAQAYLKTAQALYQQGAAIMSDVLTAKAHLASAQAAQQAAQTQVENALDAFRLTLGLDRTSAVEPGPAAEMPTLAGDIDQLVARALERNPEIAALRAQLAAREAAVEAARGASRPQINLVLRHDWNADTPALQAPATTVAGMLSWDAFDSGVRRAEIARAQAERQAVQAQLAQAEDRLRQSVAERFRAIKTAEARVQADMSAETQAQEAARLLLLRYREGIATFDQLLDARARLDRARADLVQARYQAILERGALRLLLAELGPFGVPVPDN